MNDDPINPDDHLRPNQRHLDRAEIISGPKWIDVVDRNGHPTGEAKYDTSEPITITLRGLMQVRSLEARRVRAELADKIAALETRAASLAEELATTRAARDEATRQLHAVNREANEERVQVRIRGAVAAATESRDREIAMLRARCSGLESDNAALREAKRRLRMARGPR